MDCVHSDSWKKRLIVTISNLTVFFVLLGGAGCGVHWMRVNDLDRSKEIDVADCRLISEKMSAERDDDTGVYRVGVWSRSIKKEKRLSRDAIQQYFRECMYQRGWNRATGFRKSTEDATVHNGVFALLDISVSSKDEVFLEGTGYLYRIGARQLSPDIEMRLQGHKAGETVEFNRETISTALTATRRRKQDIRKFDDISENSQTIRVIIKEIYEVK